MIRTQLEAYQKNKNAHQSSSKGKSDKTKCSEHYILTENDGQSSCGEVTAGSDDDHHNAMSQYKYDPSFMKRRPKKADDYLSLEHPTIKHRMAPNMFKQTDLNKIKNVKRGAGGGIKNTKFFNLGTKNII